MSSAPENNVPLQCIRFGLISVNGRTLGTLLHLDGDVMSVYDGFKIIRHSYRTGSTIVYNGRPYADLQKLVLSLVPSPRSERRRRRAAAHAKDNATSSDESSASFKSMRSVYEKTEEILFKNSTPYMKDYMDTVIKDKISELEEKYNNDSAKLTNEMLSHKGALESVINSAIVPFITSVTASINLLVDRKTSECSSQDSGSVQRHEVDKGHKSTGQMRESTAGRPRKNVDSLKDVTVAQTKKALKTGIVGKTLARSLNITGDMTVDELYDHIKRTPWGQVKAYLKGRKLPGIAYRRFLETSLDEGKPLDLLNTNRLHYVICDIYATDSD